ncbi:XRE family transcriptional regulator [Kocuria sp.]|uniref:XRE family transcriptional regulator n=1 Tax=Kocuria sp. TaxID=1871328 RepID=UPI00289FCEE1|nr:XRE family transcriptional regulator [Kocuria sp.]
MRKGLTKIELANILGVTERTVHKYETRGAPNGSAQSLAAVLEFPNGYFSRSGAPDIEARAVNFRAGRSTTRRERDAALAAGASGMEVNSWISGHFVLPKINVPQLGEETPQLAAIMLREAWGLGTKPLPNLIQLCESRGIRVYGLPPLAEPVDAYSLWHGGVPYIFLARRKTPERTRFDVAHELGHLVLHKHRELETTSQQEDEANRFASEFLIPRDSIVEYLPRNPTVDDIFKIKNAFKVSAMALTYAVHQAGRMTDWIYRTTCNKLGQLGYRTGEPDGMDHFEQSKVFPQVFRSEKHGQVDVERIASELALPADDVHALTLGVQLRAVDARIPVRIPQVAASHTPEPREHLRLVR